MRRVYAAGWAAASRKWGTLRGEAPKSDDLFAENHAYFFIAPTQGRDVCYCLGTPLK